MPLSPVTMRSGLRGSLPQRIAGLGLWCDASVDSSLTLNGNGVSEWRDLSGNGRHFSQATAANQPDGVTRTQGGLRVLDFDGTRFLSGNAAAANLARNVAGLTIVAVVKFDALVTDAGRVLTLQAGVADVGARATLFVAGTTFTLRSRRLDSALAFQDLEYAAGAAVTNANVFTGIVDYANTDAYLYAGGVLRDSDTDLLDAGTSADTASVSTTLGAFDAALVQPLDGFIGELIVYRRALAIAERERLETWLMAKWGL